MHRLLFLLPLLSMVCFTACKAKKGSGVAEKGGPIITPRGSVKKPVAPGATTEPWLTCAADAAPGTWKLLRSDNAGSYLLLPSIYEPSPTSPAAPGTRDSVTAWRDPQNGELRFFGGRRAGLGYWYAVGVAHPFPASTNSDQVWGFDGKFWRILFGNRADFAPSVLPVWGETGVSAATNDPQRRAGAATWTGADGQLYLFGGMGYGQVDSRFPAGWNVPDGDYADLWRFDGQKWTYLAGSQQLAYEGNYVATADAWPAARRYASTWVAPDGSFWLYGGLVFNRAIFSDPNALYDIDSNDLWRYDGTRWHLVRGGIGYHAPNWGVKGQPDPANDPGSRRQPLIWSAGDGNVYLYGGMIVTPDGTQATTYNDFWKFDGRNWTWIGGEQGYQETHALARGVAADENTPGPRWNARTWLDNDGNFYLWGGTTFRQDYPGGFAPLGSRIPRTYETADLWRYDGTRWTWLHGTSHAHWDVNENLLILDEHPAHPCTADAEAYPSIGGTALWFDPAQNSVFFYGQWSNSDVAVSGPHAEVQFWQFRLPD